MNYKKLREVKSPSRGTGRSAGTDFFIPIIDEYYLVDVINKNEKELNADQIYIDKNERQIILAPGAHILLPSGITCDLTSIDGALYDEIHGIAYIAANKSSVSKNKRLDVGATIVDEDYQGEMHFSLVNTSNRLIILKSNDKIVQFLATPIILTTPKEITGELFRESSERGEGGFGSTTN